MMDWKHDVGYREPVECGFCEHVEVFPGWELGVCWRNGPVEPTEEEEKERQRKYSVSLRGACRYFEKKMEGRRVKWLP